MKQPVVGGDTSSLTLGTEALGRCLADLNLIGCRERVGPFPVVQYVPDLLADSGAELSEANRIRGLALVSGLSVAAALIAGWIALRRVGCPEWRWGFLLVAISGPVLAYGSSTWGEMLTAALVTLLVAAGLVPARPILVGLAAFGAAASKETSYPLVVGLGLVALLLARERAGRPIRRHVLIGGAGVVFGFAASSAFNVLRFGTPKNAYYLDPAFRDWDPTRFVEFGAALFVAPNGGILFFWPLAVLVVVALLAFPLVRVVRNRDPWRNAWPSLALIVLLAGIVAGLASWWSPFGWWAWGPRLSLPWVLPILLLALAAFGSTLTPYVSPLLAPLGGLIAVTTLVVVVSLPHVGFLWRPAILGDFFLDETSVCPGGGPPPTPRYWDCLHELMWARHPIWLDALSELRTAPGIATVAAVASTAAGAAILFRRDLVARVDTA